MNYSSLLWTRTFIDWHSVFFHLVLNGNHVEDYNSRLVWRGLQIPVVSAGCNRVPCPVGKYYYGGFCGTCVGLYK